MAYNVYRCNVKLRCRCAPPQGRKPPHTFLPLRRSHFNRGCVSHRQLTRVFTSDLLCENCNFFQNASPEGLKRRLLRKSEELRVSQTPSFFSIFCRSNSMGDSISILACLRFG